MELKEFLYVDVDRVRSLLSQMAGGFIESVKKSTKTDLSGGAQAVLFGVGAKGDYAHGSQYEEARSFQDLTFVAFEGMANDAGMIMEFPGEFMDVDKWESGAVHAALQPGQLVRVECDVQLLDAGFVRSRVSRLLSMADAYVDMMTSGADTPQQLSGSRQQRAASASSAARARQEARQQLTERVLGDVGPGGIEAITRVIEALAGESVLLRVFPCGTSNREQGFSGTLLGRREYIQEERESLFSRYGQRPTKWTTVFQVTAIPEPSTGAPALDLSESLVSEDSSVVSRATLEKTVSGLMDMFEQVGIVEGPVWPSISITPLGIYREVPKAP